MGSAPTVGTGALPVAWIRSARFDLVLLLGATVIGLVVGAAANASARALPVLFLVDMWLLGYPHVFATFTRVSFDGATTGANTLRLIVFGSPVLLLMAVIALYAWRGTSAVITVYFFWQWFHYSRQSYGVERIYWRKAQGGGQKAGLNGAVVYAFAIWGVLNRSARQESFLGTELFWPPVSPHVATAAGLAATALMVMWSIQRLRELRRGELRVAHMMFVVSHVIIFTVGYIIIPNATAGWIAVNVWHNIQYLLVVWLFNANRFKTGVDSKHPFLSRISQPKNALRFGLGLIVVSNAIYWGVQSAAALTAILPLAMIVNQTINFHHYIVDGLIWKLRKPPVRAAFGIAG